MQLLIELPSRDEQIAFNRRCWAEIVRDPALADLSGKVECNAFGNVLVFPVATGEHSRRQGEIAFHLRKLLGGLALPECPISTIDGVRAADVGWYSEERFERVRGQIAFETAPEICVEVLSPDNTEKEMFAKRNLYLEAGALEVWLCGKNGKMRFFNLSGEQDASAICPEFPAEI
ncbi:MAG TPA: Uma2 family endonuclease [Bacteroidia bacterium]|nr:Uma2 family endonuclease [Bacteroidia bacterium]